jgi:hypothetical protein
MMENVFSSDQILTQSNDTQNISIPILKEIVHTFKS